MNRTRHDDLLFDAATLVRVVRGELQTLEPVAWSNEGVLVDPSVARTPPALETHPPPSRTPEM